MSVSRREHALLVVAAIVAVVAAHTIFRAGPRLATIGRIEAATESARERAQGVPPRSTDTDVAGLQRACASREAEIARCEAALADHTEHLASLGRPAANADLHLRLAGLAAEHGVHIRADAPCPAPRLREYVGYGLGTERASARLVRFLALGEPHTLPLRELSVETSFAQLRAFLRDLAALDSYVVVLRFRIDVVNGKGGLRATLLVAS